MVLAGAEVLSNGSQLFGVEVHALGQEEEQLARLCRYSVPLHLLSLQEVIRQLGRPGRHLRRVLLSTLPESSAVFRYDKVHGLLLWHVPVDCAGWGLKGFKREGWKMTTTTLQGGHLLQVIFRHFKSTLYNSGIYVGGLVALLMVHVSFL